MHPEVLEQGRGERGPRSRRTRLLVVLALLLVVVGGLVDRQVRRHETVGVARCVEGTTTAVATALGRVSVMADYVRPALSRPPSARLRQDLLDLISTSAGPGRTALRKARDRCAATDVWVAHDGLRRTRGDCLRLLDHELDYLSEVAADGRRAFGAGGVPKGRCRAP